MNATYLLERIVLGEVSPEDIPQTYKRGTDGFRGDPNRMDAFRALQETNQAIAYRSVVGWGTQIGEQIRDGTVHHHWTTCTDTLKELSEYIAADQSTHPDFLGRVIPALEEIAKQRGVEWSDHYEYQSIAMNLLFKMAKDGTYVTEARKALKSVRDDEKVDLGKRVHARNVLAHYEGFNDFWNAHAPEVYGEMHRWAKDVQVFGKYMSQYVFVDKFFKKIGEEDLQSLCLVAGITAYNEMKISKPINLKKDESMVGLSPFEIHHKAGSTAHEAIRLICTEIETGKVYNHTWDDAAKIANSNPAQLQERYRSIIQKMRE